MKLPPITHLFQVTADLRSGLRGSILKRAWSANFKMVWYVLLLLLRPELKAFSNEMAPKDPYF
jgi:hypothetical protein